MSLVVDSSVWIAILLREPERAKFIEILSATESTKQGAVTVLEAGMVARGRVGDRGGRQLELLQSELGVQIVPFDATHAVLALDAFARFGRGRHRAGLNLGDCCSYAVARALRLPLLCKGNDFPHTDLPLVRW